ncbi:MAG: hypothetical protein WC374_07085 [Phycisphaerae bacterium]
MESASELSQSDDPASCPAGHALNISTNQTHKGFSSCGVRSDRNSC